MVRLSYFYGVSIKLQHCIAAHKLPNNSLSAGRVMDSPRASRAPVKRVCFGIFHTSASFSVNKTANLLNWISSAADYIVKWGPPWKEAIRDTLSLEKTKRDAPPKISRYLNCVQVWQVRRAPHMNVAICRPILLFSRLGIRCMCWPM